MFWKIAHFLANRWDQFHMFLWDQIHINRVGPGTFLRSVPLEKDVANDKFFILLQILEQQLNETRVRKQMEISEIDGQLTEKYEAKMQQSLAVSITF